MHGFKYKLPLVAAHRLTSIRQALSGQSGASSIEYSLLITFIAAIIIPIVGFLGLKLLPGIQTVVAGF